MIGDDSEALLVDFGLARIKHAVARLGAGLLEGGNFRYLAPELLAAKGPDSYKPSPATDCYAFAMTILQMATLDRPYAEFSHEVGAAFAAEKGQRPSRPHDLGGLAPDSADALWQYLELMWAQDPSKRPRLDQVQIRLEETLALN